VGRDEVTEARATQARASAEAGQSVAGAIEGHGVDVQAEQAHVGPAPLQDRLRVSTHTDRPVDHPALMPWL